MIVGQEDVFRDLVHLPHGLNLRLVGGFRIRPKSLHERFLGKAGQKMRADRARKARELPPMATG
jgi:hypothetical protein